MKIEKTLVISFAKKEPQSEFNIRLPKGSILLDDFITLPDGVYALYLAPELITEDSEVHTYVVGGPNQSIDPSKHKYVSTVSLFAPQTDKEGNEIPNLPPATIIFPFFRLIKLAVA